MNAVRERDRSGRSARFALTFDDGPDRVWTPSLLDELKRLDVRATFFVCAPAAAANPGVIERMASEGHEVGFHCSEHVRHSSLSLEQGRIDLERGLTALAALGVSPRRWRTPWGDLASWTEGLAEDNDLVICNWTDDSHDWRADPADEMFESLAAAIGPGSVVLLHDGIGPGALRDDCRETIALLEPLVGLARDRGYELAPMAGVPA